MIPDFIPQNKTKDTGQQDADGGLHQVEHVDQRRHTLQYFRVHAGHVLQAHAKGLNIMQQRHLLAEDESENQNSENVGQNHLEHTLAIAEKEVGKAIGKDAPQVADFGGNLHVGIGHLGHHATAFHAATLHIGPIGVGDVALASPKAVKGKLDKLPTIRGQAQAQALEIQL